MKSSRTGALLSWSHSACVLPVEANQFVVFSSLFGNPVLVTGGSLSELTVGLTPIQIADSRFYRLGGPSPFTQAPDIEARLVAAGILRSANDFNTDMERLVQKRDTYLTELRHRPLVNRLGLTLTSACNFGCAYCIRESADRDKDMLLQISNGPPSVGNGSPKPAQSGGMTFETARSAVDGLYHSADALEPVSIGFSGGEPLLRWKLIEQVVPYAESLFGDRVTFGLNTNASLVTPPIAAFLAAHRFIVSTSLYGPPGVNGLARPYRRKAGETYDAIVAGVREMLDAGVRVQGVYATIVDSNAAALDEDFLAIVAGLGVQTVTFEPDLVHSSSLDPLWLAERFAHLVIAGRQLGVGVTGYWRRAYDNLFADLNNNPAQTFCGASSGEGFNVTPDGDVQNCGFSATSMGNVDQIEHVLESEQFHNYVRDNYAGFIDVCHGCAIEGLCQGGCGLTRQSASRPGRESVFRKHCRLYREVTALLIVRSVLEKVSSEPAV